ncbi:quinol monooxygenase YgiN [Chitinophaga terrae (ex Kim and Jung 2007)]|jgi:quinol monooxygenase YgiN|uniref:putative quinol monooxygenase n=1 Tax=Chitinophaga terrae (ex Kim and Jung 2007) TaxID=408074 RepID=UPI002782D812|nr:antibiotic biosynthesis monooxygenase family protein [Chitinophaga terrae (ex Kim and Jung 2007)]MDQ0106581.1 quinol monooxygenase YgiN [Chitinophaga terrae (ex Kim and Jung 2007)]
MINRIVKMEFQPDKVTEFRELFAQQQTLIRNFPGCLHLELWEHESSGNTWFTFSQWTSEEALENYRQSDLFRQTWAATKVLFNAKPAAWTVNKRVSL